MNILISIVRPLIVLIFHIVFSFTNNDVIVTIDLLFIYSTYLLFRDKDNNVILAIIIFYLISDMFFPILVGLSAVKFFGAYSLLVVVEKYFPSLSKDFAWPSLIIMTIAYLLFKNDFVIDGLFIFEVLINSGMIMGLRYLLGTQRSKFTYR